MEPACTDDACAAIPDGIGHSHKFRINYSKIKSMENGECISTPSFRSGGHEWAIMCYPQGYKKECAGFVSLFLKLVSGPKEVSASVNLSIVDNDRVKTLSRGSELTFREGSMSWGYSEFIRGNKLEDRYLVNGWFVVMCTIYSTAISEEMPCKCFLLKDISKLTETNEMADVKFFVGGETFEAHRAILGARSTVFKAQLFGSMAEKEMKVIPIKEMEVAVFKALLQFIYTDSLSDTASSDMIRGLMVAADMYAIEGLVAKCQERLLESLSLDTVVDILIVAEQHGFVKIKESCLEFMSKQENLLELALTEGYSQMVSNCPSLLEEIRRKRRKVSQS